MTTFAASIATGILLILFGVLIYAPKSNLRSYVLEFPRSNHCSLWLVTLATVWFLWRHIANLGEADFGSYKLLIGGIAVVVAVLSFKYTPDFLAVRGLAMLVLLFSREVLDALFLQEAFTRLFLVTIIYLLIVLALYFGAWPYRMRDCITWLNEKSGRFEALGVFIVFCGILISILSLTY